MDALPDDPTLHQNLLAYVSDYELLGTSTLPHGLPFIQGSVQMASLDHALWFHRECRIDEWLLYTMDSPNASGARGLARGQFFDRQGDWLPRRPRKGWCACWMKSRETRLGPRCKLLVARCCSVGRQFAAVCVYRLSSGNNVAGVSDADASISISSLEFAHDFRRRAEQQHAIRKLFALGNQRVHARQAVAADRAVLRIVLPMPIRLLFPIVQPCSMTCARP